MRFNWSKNDYSRNSFNYKPRIGSQQIDVAPAGFFIKINTTFFYQIPGCEFFTPSYEEYAKNVLDSNSMYLEAKLRANYIQNQIVLGVGIY